MSKIVDGKEIANKIYKILEKDIKILKQSHNVSLKLAVISIGNTESFKTYTNCKKNACLKLGIGFEEYIFNENTKEEEIIKLIERLNNDDSVTGIVVQLPLPKHLNNRKILEAINKEKDLDSLTPINLGYLTFGRDSENLSFAPCTALSILEILRYENIQLEGKHIVILSRSNIVGKPLALMLLNMNATVTVCHSKTKNLKDICKNADIIISATGISNIINKNMVNKNSIVIDAGINRDFKGKICGDVNFNEISSLVKLISPVPGGVGPVTVAMLLKNLVFAAKSKIIAGKLITSEN